MRQYAVERLELVKKEVATVTVKVNVGRVDVFVDGKSIGFAPLEGEVFVEPGSRAIDAKLTRYADAKQVIEAAKGSSQMVTLALAASAPVPSVTATSSAAPPPAASSTPSAPPPPLTPPRRSIVPGVVLGGLAVGAVVAGAALVVVSNSKEGDALSLSKTIVQGGQHCVGPGAHDQRCAQLDSSARDVDTLNHAGIGVLVGAGVLAAGALTYFLWPAPKAKTKPASTDVQVAPVLGAGHGGMILRGAF